MVFALIELLESQAKKTADGDGQDGVSSALQAALDRWVSQAHHHQV
jgi:hypothetical protein